MRKNRQVVFICGAGHSGSTLLGLVLGTHRDLFYAGEARKSEYLGDLTKPLKKRACKLCGLDCPVWGGFTPKEGVDIYQQLSERTGKPGIVDSTKDVDWLAARIEEVTAAGAECHLLFLQRDGRAVINSRVRKYPQSDPGRLIDDWVAQVRRTAALFDGFAGPKQTVRYEELATRPEPVVRAICDTIGIEYAPAMLRYELAEHHVLGGNNGTQYLVARARAAASIEPSKRGRDYYASHPEGIKLDLRWRTELDPAVLSLFESRAGADNAPFAWP